MEIYPKYNEEKEKIKQYWPDEFKDTKFKDEQP